VLIKCHAMVYGVVEIQLQTFLASALDGGEWSASWSGHFSSAERALFTHRTGGWLDRRAGLDAVEARKLSWSDGNRGWFFDLLVRSLVTLLTELSWFQHTILVKYMDFLCMDFYVIFTDFHIFPIKIQTNHSTDIEQHKVRNWSNFI
jgi:hypothetical protein